MRYIFMLTLLVFCFKNAFAFDLKKLGDSLQKDLGGALKELEKGINQNQGTNSTQNKSNNSQSYDKTENGVNGKIVNGICVISYTASNGKRYQSKLNIVNGTASDCEYQRVKYVKITVPDLENRIAEQKKRLKLKKENELKQAKQKEKQREKQKKIAEENKRKKIAAEKKKQEQLSVLKKNKDPRGTWGVAFNKTEEDLKGSCEKLYGIFMCKNEDGVYTYALIGKDGFPYKIYRSFGSYSITGFTKYNAKLIKRYKVIKSPTLEEREKFIIPKYGRDLIYYYKNTKKDSTKPLYITLYTTSLSYKNPKKSIYIGYFSKDYFENTILKQMEKKKKKDDDL